MVGRVVIIFARRRAHIEKFLAGESFRRNLLVPLLNLHKQVHNVQECSNNERDAANKKDSQLRSEVRRISVSLAQCNEWYRIEYLTHEYGHNDLYAFWKRSQAGASSPFKRMHR